MKDVVRVLALHPFAEGSEVVAKVNGTGGLDAGKDSGHGRTVVVGSGVGRVSFGWCRTQFPPPFLRAHSICCCT